MLKLLGCLIGYPFWAATGSLPNNRINETPGPIGLYALVIYICFGMWHWSPSAGVAEAAAGLAFNAIIVIALIRPRFATMCFMAWAASDVIYLVFDLHEGAWDWTLFAIYWIRSIHTYVMGKKKSS